MEIFTVTMTKESFSDPPVMEVFGSFMDGKRAKEFLVDKIVEMSKTDEIFYEVVWTDENHNDLCHELMGALDNRPMIFPPLPEFRDKATDVLRKYLDTEIGCGDGAAYYLYSTIAYAEDATYRFDITKNTLEE